MLFVGSFTQVGSAVGSAGFAWPPERGTYVFTVVPSTVSVPGMGVRSPDLGPSLQPATRAKVRRLRTRIGRRAIEAGRQDLSISTFCRPGGRRRPGAGFRG